MSSVNDKINDKIGYNLFYLSYQTIDTIDYIMKSVVTGSNGFIGKNLTQFLRRRGHEVVPLGHKELTERIKLQSILNDIQPDYIFHFAAYGNHAHQNEVEQIFEGNVIGTFNLLNSIKNLLIKGFVNVGSSSEYGIKTEPMKEDHILETDTFYGASKAANTYLSRAFAIQWDKPIVTVRPFSVYGEGESKARFIPQIIQSLLTGKTMDIVTEPKHDWIYIQDFLQGIVKVIENISNLKGEVVNIGTGKQFSNKEIVKKLEQITGKTLKMNVLPQIRVYDTINWIASNSRLQNLGWKQKFDINEGLKHTYEYYSQ